MTLPVDDQSLAELIGSLATSIPNLVRDELELLRTQLAFALRRLRSASAFLVVATALAMGTVLLLVAAAVSGLSMYLTSFGIAAPAAVAIASLIVAILAGLMAAAFILAAGQEMRRAGAAVEQGIDAIGGASTKEKSE
jgi:hypothetical protein